MQEKHKETIIWIGVAGGFLALITTIVQVAKGGSIQAFLTKIKGG